MTHAADTVCASEAVTDAPGARAACAVNMYIFTARADGGGASDGASAGCGHGGWV